MTTRRYEQRLRAETAEETRRRILDAVYARLRAAPTQPVSLEQVAQEARVARSTIYLVFGSRAGLFDAVAIDVLERGGFERVVEAVAHPDAREHLRQGIRAGHGDVRGLPRRPPGAVLDRRPRPGVDGRRHAARRTRAGPVAWSTSRSGSPSRACCGPTSPRQDAANILYLMTSFDTFDQLYTERGLPVDEVSRIMVATAERAVCR